MKSSDGGSTWSVQDSTFPAESISCFTIDECTAVGGLGIDETTDGRTWNPQTAPTETENLKRRVLSQFDRLCRSWDRQSQAIDHRNSGWNYLERTESALSDIAVNVSLL